MSREKAIDRVVFEDEYCGINYWIKEYGYYTEDGKYDMRWFCAYVSVPKKFRKKYDTRDLDVHGGITYNIGEIWGWDYNHCDDVDFDNGLKNKFQSKPIEEVVDIIASECQEFIRRYFV